MKSALGPRSTSKSFASAALLAVGASQIQVGALAEASAPSFWEKGRAMLKFIVAVTICVSDLSATEQAYRQFLGYQVIERASISDELAELWDTPAMAGSDYIVMQPESGADIVLRFIAQEPVEGYAMLRTEGWNAVELLVQDTDAVAARLVDSPFEILGQPRDLTTDGMVRAMQARGPADEMVYLTRIAGERTALLGEATSFVDRPFIVVIGARDETALIDFYGARLSNETASSGDFPITMISKAYGLPLETTYPITSARLEGKFSIEMDKYPEQAIARPRRDGELPPGIAMVSFGVESLDQIDLEWRARPKEIMTAPYGGRRAAIAVGPAGEWIEFVEEVSSK